MKTTAWIPLLLVLITACSSPRKACRMAERAVARATVRCPQLLQRDTLVVELPGDTVTIPATPYADAELDSLQAACQQLAEALAAERDLYAVALAQRPSVPAAVAAVRRASCRYRPFTYEHELFTLSAAGGDTPGVHVQVKPRRVSVPCPPAVTISQLHGAAQWYRGGFWLLLVFAALLSIIILRGIGLSFRANHPHG